MLGFTKKRRGIIIVAFSLLIASCGTKDVRDQSGAKEKAEAPEAPAKAEPTLVISSEGNYWHSGEFTLGGNFADIVVDTNRKYQKWHGLGGTFNEAGWHAMRVLSEAERREIMQLLFDKEDGIGFTWGRIPIGASDYALNRYTHNNVFGDRTMQFFSIARDRHLLIPYIKAAQRVNEDITFWGSPWTPPPWMKTNASHDGGAFNPAFYEAYARYFVRWVEAYQALGIPIDHVQPQNEPGWSQAYPSCAWGPSTEGDRTIDRPVTLGIFVEEYLAPALEEAGLDAGVWYGTLSNNSTFQAYWQGLSDFGRAQVTGVGLQWGTSERVPEIANTTGKDGKAMLVMQTEHKCGNYPWLDTQATSPLDANRDNFLPFMAPNNHAYAEESWDLLREWIEAGVHVYSAWNMVLDRRGFNMDSTRPWPQNALITVNTDNRKFQVTPAYYVFRHIGQYVDTGATRVAIRGGNALAFQNPDDSVTAILFNAEPEATYTTLSIDGELIQFEIPARGWATVRW